MIGLSVMKSRLHGFGCFATVHIPKNCAIAEYAGERITRTEAMRRMRQPGVKRISELETDLYVDGSVDGNDTKYINHSCEPNADVFIIDGLMIVFALQEIVPGEEITVDYLTPSKRTERSASVALPHVDEVLTKRPRKLVPSTEPAELPHYSFLKKKNRDVAE